jgi:hypothetical protein
MQSPWWDAWKSARFFQSEEIFMVQAQEAMEGEGFPGIRLLGIRRISFGFREVQVELESILGEFVVLRG